MTTEPELQGYKLRNLKVRRVDHVDKGANQESDIVFYKADSDGFTTTEVAVVEKSTPGRAKALRALAEAKKRNKRRMTEGKKPIVDGEEVSPRSLEKSLQEQADRTFELLKHGGPSGHPVGSGQDVHGNWAAGDRPKAQSVESGGNKESKAGIKPKSKPKRNSNKLRDERRRQERAFEERYSDKWEPKAKPKSKSNRLRDERRRQERAFEEKYSGNWAKSEVPSTVRPRLRDGSIGISPADRELERAEKMRNNLADPFGKDNKAYRALGAEIKAIRQAKIAGAKKRATSKVNNQERIAEIKDSHRKKSNPKPMLMGVGKSVEEEEMNTSDTIKKVLATVTKGLIDGGVFVETATPEDFGDILPEATVQELSKILSAESAITKENGMAFSTEGLPDEAVEYIKSLEASVDELSEALDASDDEAEDFDPIEKALTALPPEVARIIKADRDRAAATEEALASEIAKRLDDEYIAKVNAYENVIADVTEVGKALRRLNASAPEDAALIEKALADASVRLAEAGLFQEIGKSIADTGTGDAYGRATEIAKGMVEKGEAKDINAARGKVWETHPDLYNEYKSESASLQAR